MTVSKTTSASNLPKIPGAVGKAFRAAAKAASDEMAKAVLAQAKVETRRANAVATKEYANSWKVFRRGYFQIVIQNSAPHAGFVENGRGPSKKGPPPAKLLLWVKRKLGISDPKQAVRAAILIGRKIRRHGIKGRGVLAATLKAAQPKMNAIIKKHFGSAAGKASV